MMTSLTNEKNNSEQSVNGNKPHTRRQRKALPPLPSTASASEMSDVVYSCKVDTTPISWYALPLYGMFSLSADGSYPQVKISKSKRFEIRTGISHPCGGGRCYRVMF